MHVGRKAESVNLLIGSHCLSPWCGAAVKLTLMMHEAAAHNGGNGEGAWGDTETVGKVEGGTEGLVEGKSQG